MWIPFNCLASFCFSISFLGGDEGRRIGAKKVLKPFGVWARRIAMLESVAEENHLNPLMDQGPSEEVAVLGE